MKLPFGNNRQENPEPETPKWERRPSAEIKANIQSLADRKQAAEARIEKIKQDMRKAKDPAAEKALYDELSAAGGLLHLAPQLFQELQAELEAAEAVEWAELIEAEKLLVEKATKKAVDDFKAALGDLKNFVANFERVNRDYEAELSKLKGRHYHISPESLLGETKSFGIETFTPGLFRRFLGEIDHYIDYLPEKQVRDYTSMNNQKDGWLTANADKAELLMAAAKPA